MLRRNVGRGIFRIYHSDQHSLDEEEPDDA